MTGCLRLTPLDNLSILAGIQPAEFRREEATLSLSRRALDTNHLLHHKICAPVNEHPNRFKLRYPFVLAAQQLSSEANNHGISAANWADYKWEAKWKSDTTDSTATFSTLDPM